MRTRCNIAALHAPRKFHRGPLCFFMCGATKMIQKMLHATLKKINRVLFFFIMHATFLLNETNILKCCTVEPLSETFL